MTTPRLIIEIFNGCISQLITNGQPIEITIIDYDNPSHETGCEESAVIKTDEEFTAYSNDKDSDIFEGKTYEA